MPKTYSIVGMNFQKSDAIVKALQTGHPVVLVREPKNEFDANAVAVWVDGKKVGYIPSKQNKVLAPYIDQAGTAYIALDSSQEPSASIAAKFVRSPNSGYPLVEV